MKYLLLAIGAVLVAGCSHGGSTGVALNEAGISAAIIGSWEIDTMSMKGQTVKPERPNPADPFRESGSNEFYQLRVTDQSFALIGTNFVSYYKFERPYKIEGKKIVTVEPDADSMMTDFLVHGYSVNTLTLEGVGEDGKATGLMWNFKRINENALATKMAKAVTFEQSMLLSIEVGGDKATSLDLQKSVKGETDYRVEGLHDYIMCSLNRDGELKLNYGLIEVRENSISSSGSTDMAYIAFKGLKPDLLGPKKKQDFSADTELLVRLEGKTVKQTVTSCNHTVTRDGAALEVITTCNDSGTKTSFGLKSVCLLRRGLFL